MPIIMSSMHFQSCIATRGFIQEIKFGDFISMYCAEVTIGFFNQSYNASESDGAVSVEVGIISGSLQREVSVQFTSSDSSALSKS